MLAELGPTLHGLFVHYHSSLLGRAQLDNFDRCMSLRRLHFSYGTKQYIVARILAACSGNLRELALGGDTLSVGTTNAIADNCVNLRKLQMDYRCTVGDLRRVWQTVGPTLQDLSLDLKMLDTEDWLVHIQDLTTFCVHVKAFEYNSMSSSFLLLVVLCRTLGPQLKSLRFVKYTRFPSNVHISKILDSCTNLHFRIDAIFGFQRLTSLAVFKDRLRSITIEDRFSGDAKEAGDSVPSLEKLCIYVFDMHTTELFLSSFFFSPKPALKSLHMTAINSPLRRDVNPLDTLAGW